MVAKETALLPPPITHFGPSDTAAPSARPQWVQRHVSAVRDFPLGCRPSSAAPRPPVTPPHGSEFKGEVDPVAAKIWLKEMEKALTFIQNQLEVEFLELKQGEKGVLEYEAKFTELARLVPGYVSTEFQKARRFQHGLKPKIHSGVVALQLKTYPSVVQAVLVIESDQKLDVKEKVDKKRKYESITDKADQEESSRKFSKRFSQNRNKRFRRQSVPQKGHYASECCSGNPGITCFKFGKAGHIARNYRASTQGRIGGSASQGLANSTARARTFKMNKRSNAQDSDIVTGTLSLNSIPVKVLFDSGVSKSFISKECVIKMDLILEDLAEPLTIEVANQDRVAVSQFCPRCQLEILGNSFSDDLIPFELGEFDVILGIDWLSQHKANIDYKKKKSVMFTENNVRINYQGQKQEKKFLPTLKAKKLLRQGCEAYLAHIVDTEKEEPNLDEIPIVRKFPDVFPDELPRLPPDREIEFSIDLVPEAEPVSKAPYHMAPVEMKELANQLQVMQIRDTARIHAEKGVIIFTHDKNEYEINADMVEKALKLPSMNGQDVVVTPTASLFEFVREIRHSTEFTKAREMFRIKQCLSE
ncbi:uncharacterized protein LOC141690407 [Apium graveolens]|uniref:uncharacterized protein LOC141690407 n=1 Tax=Apium graveolens TaxID=4045 RepID=UPI003D7A8363